jgi:Ca-activated chloride channel family protein
MPVHHRGIFGNPITTYQWFDNALNPELLQLIAKTTHGKFYRATDESALEQVFREIDHLERSNVKSREKVRYEDIYGAPLKLGLLILFISQILERGWWRFLP